MGDRILVVCHDGQTVAPAIYGHWLGHEAPALLVAAGEAGILRKNDESYTAARVCGFFHEQSARETTGLGLLDAPEDLKTETLRAASHGDAGVITLNVKTGELAYFDSYHKTEKPDDWDDEDGEFRPAPTSVKLTD